MGFGEETTVDKVVALDACKGARPLDVVVGEGDHLGVLVELGGRLFPGRPGLGRAQGDGVVVRGQLLVVGRDKVLALGFGNGRDVASPGLGPDV